MWKTKSKKPFLHFSARPLFSNFVTASYPLINTLRSNMRKTLLIILSVLVLGGGAFAAWWYLSEEPVVPVPEVRTTIPFLEHDSQWADSVLKSLTLDQKIGQLFLIASTIDEADDEDSLVQWINDYHIGGVCFTSGSTLEQTVATQGLQDTSTVPLWIDGLLPNDALVASPSYSRYCTSDSSIIRELDSTRVNLSKLLQRQFGSQHSLETAPVSFRKQDATILPNADDGFVNLDYLLQQDDTAHLLSAIGPMHDYYDFEFDTLNLKDSLLHRYRHFTYNGAPMLSTDADLQFNNPQKELGMNHLRHYLANYLEFEGLVRSEPLLHSGELTPVQAALYAGSDLLVINDTAIALQLQSAIEWIKDGGLPKSEIDARVHRILLAKSWTGLPQRDTLAYDQALLAAKSPKQKALVRRVHENSIALLQNPKTLLPLSTIKNDSLFCVLEIGNAPKKEMLAHLKYYSKYRYRRIKTKEGAPIGKLDADQYKKYDPIVVHLNNLQLTAQDSSFLNGLEQLAEQHELIIVNQNEPLNATLLPTDAAVLQVFGNSSDATDYSMQAIFGGVALKGQLPANISDSLTAGTGEQWAEATRLSYGFPEEVGMSSDTLKRIRYIANSVINAKATPGCQVWVARKGKVIYHKSFGHHTYAKRRQVRWDHLYDLASITKVAATTISAMKRYDEGKFQLEDPLREYLPDSIPTSNIKDITWKEILIHKTGLSSGQKIMKYLTYTNDSVGRYDKYFCDYSDNYYSVLVADSFYLDSAYIDSIWLDINHMWIDRAKPYKYSDANFNLLYFLLESFLPPLKRFDDWVNETFYKPLGLQTMCYLPRKRFSTGQIVPTENEKYWRRQLLCGRVHDPTAALMGGVAGNAGLFSNANDMGILFQMLHKGGTYGGKQYLKSSTVNLFTRQASNSHRGLGFNKPTSAGGIFAPEAPLTTFGHTGFTGTCIWVDPEEELVYVFLSNRVHPLSGNRKLVQNGTRKRIHQALYDAIEHPPKIIPALEEEPTDSLTKDSVIQQPL